MTPPRKQGLGHRVAGGGEVTDVVVAEVRRRVAQQDRARAVVEARRDLQLAALRPTPDRSRGGCRCR